ncbi:Endoribonuclease Dicer [Cyphomyrmex costatus]|uniref:Endoribonuclease Dicer n=1 Tax=Cyphomyrmex costatus TaxID=456900 RepID=A0A195C4Z1_9HYME|nr:Endoribonuclease Dicer [Cyphomyrmex costatus]
MISVIDHNWYKAIKSKIFSENMFKPRSYQIDLYERAIQDNTIVYLPTGSGKTYIAVMLLKHLSRDIRKSYQEGGKRSAFIVNTVALVEQQSQYIQRHTDLKCRGYSGDMKVDFWSHEEWLSEIEAHEVLVMTSQIFLNLLIHGYLTLDRINLIIFDECHRAVSNHPMRQIMQQFTNCSKKEQPRVLAMSATLLNANIKADKIESTIKALEITFHAKIATVDSIDSIQEYCTNPKEKIITYTQCLVPEIMKQLNDVINTSTEVCKNLKLNFDEIYKESSNKMKPRSKSSKLILILEDIEKVTLQAGLYCGSKSALLHLIQLESMRKYSNDRMTNFLLDYLITQVLRIRKMLDNEMKDCTEIDQLHNFSCDQIQKLFEMLKHYNKELNEQKFCCIIFVRERFMTQVIYHILKILSEHDEQYSFLKPDYVVGFQNDPYKNSKEVTCIAKWNKQVLQRFKNGSSNCIVATDVVDEGIDIPTCTLIIRYDIPIDFRAYVQSKGRARHNLSNYLIFTEGEDNDDFLIKYYQYKTTEDKLRKILMGQTMERTLPTQDDIINCLYHDFDIEPYIIKHDGVIVSQLTELAVIDLINLYCGSLLSSKFVNLVPIWKLDECSTELYRVSLKLPNLSPLKTTIYGKYMKSIPGAKRSAAMNTCIKLHELSALNDKLLPATNEELTKNLDFLFPNWINEDDKTIGTHKRKRQHQLEHPLALYGAYPQSSQLLHLHVFDCTSICPVTSYDNRRIVFYNLLNDKSGFGILSTKSLPKISSFPIFMKDGKLNVNVKSDHTTMMLSENKIKLLKRFNFLLFSEIIPVIKNFMIFDNDNLENSFVIVPLNDKQEINWNIVETYQDLERITPTIPFHFRTSDYELALVTPSYRHNAVYIVTRVCDDLTPESCFPNEDFDTYTHYYKEKHGLKIENLQQSMLEVKPIPIKINYIKPRKLPEGSLKYKKTDDTVEDLQEHLVPELCYKINFPSVYWLKATTLPSILHRICQILIAEDLRVIIAKKIGLGTSPLKELSFFKIEENFEKLNEEDYSNGLDFMDDSIEKTLSDQSYSDLNVFDLDCNLFIKDQEPRDLYRNIDDIQMIDIHHYNQFMHEDTYNEDENIKKNVNKKIGHYIQRPVISAPSLNILSDEQPSFSQGPNSIEIMQLILSNHIKGAAKLLKWFGILPDFKINELLDSNSQNSKIITSELNYHMPWADTLEIRIGYKFKNRELLLQAFTHPSYTANTITECYQKLEFIGDAILDFLITCYIYENNENLSPGKLTDLRSALVNNITFACLSIRYGLHVALLSYAPKLHEIIDRFVKFQEGRDYVVNDEDIYIFFLLSVIQLLCVLIEEDECNLTEYIDVPKVLGDIFESLIGAIYFDCGKNLVKVWEIIYSFMHKEIDEFSRNIPKQPVRVIYENTDIHPKFLEAILIKGTDTVMIPLKITIGGKEKLFHGFGSNKKQAKCAAAKQALKRLQLEKLN